MRIATYIQNRMQSSSLSKQMESIEKLRYKISSGKNLINSSDDPILSQSILNVSNYINSLDSYKKNISNAKNRTHLFENSITASLGEINRVSELVKSAETDTSNDVDRKNIAKELTGILSELLRYTNVTDSNGEYIFSGNNSSVESFSLSNGSYTYIGSLQRILINTNPDSDIVYNENGQSVFGDILTGNETFEITQTGSGNTGTAETSVGAVDDISSYIEDTYTLTFSVDGFGKTVYQVTGLNSGQIIPTPPDNPPEYHSGDTIAFNGINFSVKGDPNPADAFVIRPSRKQNMLETINQLITLLDKPITNASEKAEYHQKISQLSACVKNVNRHLTTCLSEVGYRAKELDVQENANTSDSNDQKLILAGLQEVDPYELIPEMYARSSTLEMSEKIYSELQTFYERLLQNVF